MIPEPLIPTEQILAIVRQVVSKYRRHNHADYEDFVQDVLLGVFERMTEYDPARGKAETFIISVAYQKANDRTQEERRYRRQTTTNHRSRIPYRVRLREVGEADKHGRLRYDDPSVRLSRIRHSLDPEQEQIFSLLRLGNSSSDIERQMNISTARFQEIVSSLIEIFSSKKITWKFFEK